MILIIDGYNLLKTMLGSQESSEHKKNQLVSALAAYKNGHTLQLIFDGGLTQHKNLEKHNEHLSVIHVGYKKSADDYIKIVLGDMKGKECALVSSDNELIESALCHDIVALDSALFARVLEKKDERPISKTRTADLRKLNKHATEEIDELMEVSSRTIPRKPEGIEPRRERARVTKSKYEKRVMKVLKKL